MPSLVATKSALARKTCVRTPFVRTNIIQLSSTEFLVPSATVQDKLYKVDKDAGLCECLRGFLKGPCKHKGALSIKYKLKNFDAISHQNENMRSFYYFLGTGNNR